MHEPLRPFTEAIKHAIFAGLIGKIHTPGCSGVLSMTSGVEVGDDTDDTHVLMVLESRMAPGGYLA